MLVSEAGDTGSGSSICFLMIKQYYALFVIIIVDMHYPAYPLFLRRQDKKKIRKTSSQPTPTHSPHLYFVNISRQMMNLSTAILNFLNNKTNKKSLLPLKFGILYPSPDLLDLTRSQTARNYGDRPHDQRDAHFS